MSLTDKLRTQHIETIMQTLAAKPHRKRIMHLDDISSIGLILPPAANPPDTDTHADKDRITLSQFNTLLKKRSTPLRTIRQPASQDQTDKNGLPRTDYLQPFTSYHYDLLIDATGGNNLFGPYVTLCTSSCLRVGYSMIPPTPEGNEKSINESHLSNTVKNPTFNLQLVRADAGICPYNLNDIYDLLILGRHPLDLATYLPNILQYLVQIRK